MKSNVISAAVVGLVIGILVEVFLAFVGRIPLIGLLFLPVAILFGLGLPILIGALAAAWGERGIAGALDGALAALLAELVSRLFGFCASLVSGQSFFFGPRYLLPSVETASRALYFGFWQIGWLVTSLAIAALLGALGAFLYTARRR